MQQILKRPKGRMLPIFTGVSFMKREKNSKFRKNTLRATSWFLDLSKKETFEKLLTSDAESTEGIRGISKKAV